MKFYLKILTLFFEFVLLFVAEKLVFSLIYGAASGATATDLLGASLWHGLSLDFSVAAYLTAVPLILTSLRIWRSWKWIGVAEKIYLGVVSILLSAIFILDLVLYSYWGFRLDTTPLFYFLSSPAAAFASVSLWVTAAGIVGVCMLSAAIFLMLMSTMRRFSLHPARGIRRKGLLTGGMVVSAGVLFLVMRGGVTVSTMNLSRAYFSGNPRLNHVAVNPAFSLLYSAMRQHDFGSQFNFYSDEEAAATFRRMTDAAKTAVVPDSIRLLKRPRPDIYIILLESFSSHLMPSLGGAPVAMKIDSIAGTGISWVNAYASGFRTDRGIPAVLSGYPTQPTLSVMKYVEKAECLPSIARVLRDSLGYKTEYYYGGDANFTNMRAYLVSQGFGKIVSDKDFPISQKASKWGALDEVLFSKTIADIKGDKEGSPRFAVIQTSSSHEPFEVPYSNPRFADNPRANAFCYTDSCVADFIRRVENTPRGERALFILVSDHYGAWPMRDSLPSAPSRHHIPLIFCGPALNAEGLREECVASQTDIAATLLSMLGLPHGQFKFSRNLFGGAADGAVWIAEPDIVGLIGNKGYLIYNIESSRFVESKGENSNDFEKEVKSYLQYLYDDIEQLDKR